MITIQITNAADVVKQQKGWLVAKFGGLIVDLHSKVEEAVMEKVRAALLENGVEAIVQRVPTP